MPGWLKSALLLVLAVVLGLGTIETVLRLLVPMRNVGPSFTRYDDYYGKRLKPNLETIRYAPEFTMTFSTNSLGFRGPEPRQSLHGAVLFLGDSFTMGYGVSDGEEFPALIRARLDLGGAGAPVINAGIGNSGNGHWLKFLRTEAPRYRPKLVVLQIHRNDFYNNVVERLFELTDSGELRELPVPPPNAARRLQRVIESIPGVPHLHLLGLIRQIRSSTAHPVVSGAGARAPELTVRLIEEALQICGRNRWPVLGLLIDVDPGQTELLGNVFAEFDAEFVVFPGADERPDLYYEVDGHWKAEGHRLATQLLFEKVGSYTVADASRGDDPSPRSRREWR